MNATCWVAGSPLPTQPAGGSLLFNTVNTVAPAAVNGSASIQASARDGGGIPLDGGSSVIVAGETQVVVVKAADSLGNTAATDIGMVATITVLASPAAPAARSAALLASQAQNQSAALAAGGSGPRVLALGAWNATLGGYVLSYQISAAGNYTLQLAAQPPSGPRAAVTWAAQVVPGGADAANTLLVAAPDATAGHPGAVAFLVRDRFGNAHAGATLGPRPSFGVSLADQRDALNSVSEPAVPSWNGTHLLGTFQLSRAGTYRILLSADGTPVEPLMAAPGVARYVVVRGGAPGGGSSAHGDGLVAATVGLPASFAVAAMDAQGNRVRPADGAAVSVSVALSPFLALGAQLLAVPAAVAFDASRGEFIVTYTPPAPGQLTISVAVGGEPVACSPFQLNATAGPAAASKSTLAGGGTVGGVVGMPMRITVVARDASGVRRTSGGDSVRAALSVVGQPAVPLAPTDNDDGTYTFTAVPTVQGQGVVAVLLNGQPLSAGCPRTTQATAAAPSACLVTVYPAPHAQTLDVSRTSAEGAGLAQGVASATLSGEFRLWPYDIFGVQWYSPAPVVRVTLNGSDDGVSVENQADGSVRVRYASRVAGEFQLAITVADTDVTAAARRAFLSQLGLPPQAFGSLTALRVRPAPTDPARSFFQLSRGSSLSVEAGATLSLDVFAADRFGNAQVYDAQYQGDAVQVSAPGLTDLPAAVSLAPCAPGPAPNCSWPARYAAGGRSQPSYTVAVTPALAGNFSLSVRLAPGPAGAHDASGGAPLPAGSASSSYSSLTMAVRPGPPSARASAASGQALLGLTAGRPAAVIVFPFDARGNRVTALSSSELYQLSCGALLRAPNGSALSFGGSGASQACQASSGCLPTGSGECFFTVRITPQLAGPSALHVRLCPAGKSLLDPSSPHPCEVAGSPFLAVPVAAGPPDAARTQLSAPAVVATASGRTASVSVLAADAFGNPASAGDASSFAFYARCLPDCPFPGTPGSVAPAPGGAPGAYVATVSLPAGAGAGANNTRFELRVLFGGLDVGGATARPSPLTLTAPPPVTSAANSFAFGDGLLSARAGQAAAVGVQPVDLAGEYLSQLAPGEALGVSFAPPVTRPQAFVPVVARTANGYRTIYKFFQARAPSPPAPLRRAFRGRRLPPLTSSD